MRKIDVTIILGGGIDKQGIISTAAKERADRFLKSKNKLSNTPILLSGRWSGLAKDAPKITEAQAMKEYLITKGINSKRIYLEIKSLDTVSNAIYSKKIVERHKGWRKILLLTSDWHMKRALWIFHKIFRHPYQIRTLPVASDKKNDDRKAFEDYLLVVAKKILRKAKSRRQDMIKLLQEIHPFYSDSKQARKLLQEIIVKRKKILT